MTIFTPATLALRWECSERHIRNLIASGELRSFKLGGKLIRIRGEDVESYECQSGSGASQGLGGSSPLRSTGTVGATAIHSTPMMRAKLNGLRRRSMPILHRPKGRTVKDLWNAYCTEKSAKPIATTMKYTWKAIGPHFGHRDGEAVTEAECQSYTAYRRKQGRSDGAIHTELGHLRTVLVWAQKKRLIGHAPEITRPQKPAPKDRHLTKEEAQRILNAATLPHVKLAIHLMLGTAARVSAVLGLTWDRVDFKRGLIHLIDPELKGPTVAMAHSLAGLVCAGGAAMSATDKHNKLAHEFIMKVARGTSQSEMMVVIETILFGSMLLLHRRDGMSKGNACEMIETAVQQATDRLAAHSVGRQP